MTQRSPPRPHAPSPSFLHTLDMPLSLSAMAQVLRDAEHLTARYGSTSAACARLDELERAHIELQQKLSMAMVAAAAAQVDQADGGAGRSGAGTGMGMGAALDVDALLTFLQRHSACRGDLELLVPLLHDFMHAQASPPGTRFPPRDILISVHEIRPIPTEAPQYPPQHQHQPLELPAQALPQSQSHSQSQSQSRSQQQPPPVPRDRAAPSPGPRAAEITKRRKTAEVSRMTPKGSKATPSSSASSSPARALTPAHSQSVIAAAASAARLAAAAAGHANGASAPKSAAASAPLNQPEPQEPPAQPQQSSKSTRSALKPHNTRRARQEQKQAARAAVTLSALAIARTLTPASSTATATATATATPKAKASTTTEAEAEREAADPTDAENNTSRANGAGSHQRSQDASAASPGAAAVKRTRVGSSSSSQELVVKQNLFLPHDKRNIVELKHSSSFLTLEALEALNRAAPWDVMYKQRALFSHILDVATLDERAAKWFIGALRVQFVWRREFWERLHWLAMSETVCAGAGWEKYRQTRKRRANKAIAAWRKVYGDSLELMKLGLLPEDVWCDVALWYMPPTPLYWLPNSSALDAELREIDARHPVRCYHVHDLTQHPFYEDKELKSKYPRRFELPSPQVLALQNEDKESRVNLTPE
ncbi:hypothetical protein PINS_up014191 [Pythium insidiosum]|nr:hypothetical protein PINS_up014191 [Pythium insidiosum]